MTALVLASGGAKGAYQAGFLARLAEDPRFVEGFDFISGSSVGALNAAGLAQFNKAEFQEATRFLERTWADGVDILRWRWPFGLPGLWRNSFASDKPLRRFVYERLNVDALRNSDVTLSVSTVRLEDGHMQRFTEQFPEIQEALLASSAIPGVFPPVRLNGDLYVDGAVEDDAPLKPAIDAGAADILVIALTNPEHMRETKSRWRGWEVAMQAFEIQQMKILEADLRLCSFRNLQHGYRNVSVRVICPSVPLRSSLDFSQDTALENIRQGRLDAEDLLR